MTGDTSSISKIKALVRAEQKNRSQCTKSCRSFFYKSRMVQVAYISWAIGQNTTLSWPYRPFFFSIVWRTFPLVFKFSAGSSIKVADGSRHSGRCLINIHPAFIKKESTRSSSNKCTKSLYLVLFAVYYKLLCSKEIIFNNTKFWK